MQQAAAWLAELQALLPKPQASAPEGLEYHLKLLLRRQPELLPQAGTICELCRRAAEQAHAAYADSLAEPAEPAAAAAVAVAVAAAGQQQHTRRWAAVREDRWLFLF